MQFSCHKISSESKENGVERTSCCDFKVGLNGKECLYCFQLAQGNKALSRGTIFIWFTAFRKCRHSLLEKKHTERPLSSLVPENVPAIWKMLIDDNDCTYQIMQKQFNIGYTAVHEIIEEELHT